MYHPVGLTVMLCCESFAFFSFWNVFVWDREWWGMVVTVLIFGGLGDVLGLLAKHDFGLLDLHFSRLWILAVGRLTMSLSLSYLYSVAS